MCKNKLLLLVSLVIVPFAISCPVRALSHYMTADSEVYVGDGFMVEIDIEAVAAWNIHVASEGPVDGCTLSEADVTADAKNTAKTFTLPCEAIGSGVVSISLSGDYTTEDGTMTELSEELTVNAIEKEPERDPEEESEKTPAEADDQSKDTTKKDASSPNTGVFTGADGPQTSNQTQVFYILLASVSFIGLLALVFRSIKSKK